MNLEVLQRFITIAEHGSYRAAARSLYVAQPTLSRQMKQLEEELGVLLFERGRWGMKLTSEGEKLLPRVRRLVGDADSLRAFARGSSEVVIRVGAAATAVGSFLAPFLTHWAEAHPRVRIKLLEDGAVNLRNLLEGDECDLALLAAPIPDGFQNRAIKAVSLRAFVPSGHPLADADGPVPIQDLEQYPILLNNGGFLAAQLFRSACQLAEVEPDIVYESSVGQTLAALAENGAGVAVISDTVDLRGFELVGRQIDRIAGSPIQFTLHVAWRAHPDSTPHLDALADELTSFVSTLS